MRKKILIVLTGVMLLGATGCGVAEDLAEGAKEQLEWTEENGALTNGRSSDEQLAETVEDLTGIDISDSLSDNSTTSTTGFGIGETVSLTFTSNGAECSVDITVTECKPVFNDFKDVTAIFYTLNNTGNSRFSLGNSDFVCYADNKYIDQTFWGEYGIDSRAELMPGTIYEGCFIADVDANTVSTIDLYLDSFVFHVWNNGASTVYVDDSSAVGSTSDVVDGATYAGFYSDSNGKTCDVSFYSSPEGSSVGTIFVSIEGNLYSGEMEYDTTNGCYKCMTENGDEITIYFEEYEGTPSVSLCIVRADGVIFGTDYIPMTEHYES